jgi:hypothetical protein
LIGTSRVNDSGVFNTFKPFNRYAPFKAHARFKFDVQEFTRPAGNFKVQIFRGRVGEGAAKFRDRRNV